MTLTLKVRNFDRLDNGVPIEFVLHRRSAVIGRATTSDWCLPDPRNHISSKHCEIVFAGGFYTLTDLSLNGTFLNGAGERMGDPRRIEDGDVLVIGPYEVVARLSGEAIAAIEKDAESAAPRRNEWRGWDDQMPTGPQPASGAAASDDWDSVPMPPEPATPPIAPLSGAHGWVPSTRAPDPPQRSTWEPEPTPSKGPSGWSSESPDRPPPPLPDDIWGRLDDGIIVDWARAGFGQPDRSQRDPLGLGVADPADGPDSVLPPHALPAWPETEGAANWLPEPPHAPRSQNPPSAAPLAQDAPVAALNDSFDAFLDGAGIDADQLAEDPVETLERAGQLLRHLIAGLFLMLEARTRAKSQMGAEMTSFSFDGNNPLKFTRSPEEALALVLKPPQRGFLGGTRAVEDAFFDLQSHQVATLKAMQGALKTTLDRFSPSSIRQRAEAKGLLKLLPNAHEAALWRAYEKEFGGVAQGSDEAFIDVFAREFRNAYEEQSARQRRT